VTEIDVGAESGAPREAICVIANRKATPALALFLTWQKDEKQTNKTIYQSILQQPEENRAALFVSAKRALLGKRVSAGAGPGRGPVRVSRSGAGAAGLDSFKVPGSTASLPLVGARPHVRFH